MAHGWERINRLLCDSLGVDYTEEAIIECISGKRIIVPKAKAAAQSKPNLLIDVQAKMAEGKGKGYACYGSVSHISRAQNSKIYCHFIPIPYSGAILP